MNSDDLYADLIADVAGFEELMRVRIAVTVGQSCREVERGVLEGWLGIGSKGFEHFVREVCGWGVDDVSVDGGGGKGKVVIPVNKENEARGTVVREEVRFDRMCRSFPFLFRFYRLRSGARFAVFFFFFMGLLCVANGRDTEFARIIRRAYEQPA